MAGPSKVDYTLKKDETVVSIGYTQLGIVPLPGHSPNQIGIVVNNILFCADSVFSKETLEKHRIPFFTDIDKTRETLAFLRDSSYDFYIPSHAEPRKSLVQLVDANLEVIDNIETRVLDEIATRKTTGQVLKCVSSACGIEVRDEPQYYLLNTMMLGYLGSLYGRGKAKIAIEGNMLFWERAKN